MMNKNKNFSFKNTLRRGLSSVEICFMRVLTMSRKMEDCILRRFPNGQLYILLKEEVWLTGMFVSDVKVAVEINSDINLNSRIIRKLVNNGHRIKIRKKFHNNNKKMRFTTMYLFLPLDCFLKKNFGRSTCIRSFICSY